MGYAVFLFSETVNTVSLLVTVCDTSDVFPVSVCLFITVQHFYKQNSVMRSVVAAKIPPARYIVPNRRDDCECASEKLINKKIGIWCIAVYTCEFTTH